MLRAIQRVREYVRSGGFTLLAVSMTLYLVKAAPGFAERIEAEPILLRQVWARTPSSTMRWPRWIRRRTGSGRIIDT